MILNEIIQSIHSSKKIVIVTGAGVSTSSGIPDFRSKDGLYELVKKKYPTTLMKGQELFDVGVFKDKEKLQIFYHFIAGLKKTSDLSTPTPTHEWFRTLSKTGKLQRVYTQNIDDLDKRVGLKTGLRNEDVVIQLHGDLETVSCTLCKYQGPFTPLLIETFYNGAQPTCPTCEAVLTSRRERGKRSVAVGVLRPHIVLYGEHHPDGEEIAKIVGGDVRKCPDLLVVIGTSLKIPGIKRLIKDFAAEVHSRPKGMVLFLNMTPAGKEWDDIFDHQILGPCDKSIMAIQKQVDEMKEEDDTARTKREDGRAARAEKARRESKGTRQITEFFKAEKAGVERKTSKNGGAGAGRAGESKDKIGGVGAGGSKEKSGGVDSKEKIVEKSRGVDGKEKIVEKSIEALEKGVEKTVQKRIEKVAEKSIVKTVEGLVGKIETGAKTTDKKVGSASPPPSRLLKQTLKPNPPFKKPLKPPATTLSSPLQDLSLSLIPRASPKESPVRRTRASAKTSRLPTPVKVPFREVGNVGNLGKGGNAVKGVETSPTKKQRTLRPGKLVAVRMNA